MINTPGHADIFIVKAAVESSHFHSVSLIGKDTTPLATTPFTQEL